jgi:hypothetical protein
MAIRLNNAMVNAYVLQLTNNPYRAAVVATVAANLAEEGRLLFPLGSAEDLRPVFDSIIASMEGDDSMLSQALLESWSEDAFPLEDPLKLARSFLSKVEAQTQARTVDERASIINDDPTICARYRYPPRT